MLHCTPGQLSEHACVAVMANTTLPPLPNNLAFWRVAKLPVAEIRQRFEEDELQTTSTKSQLARRLRDRLGSLETESASGSASSPSAGRSTPQASPLVSDDQVNSPRRGLPRRHRRSRRHMRSSASGDDDRRATGAHKHTVTRTVRWRRMVTIVATAAAAHAPPPPPKLAASLVHAAPPPPSPPLQLPRLAATTLAIVAPVAAPGLRAPPHYVVIGIAIQLDAVAAADLARRDQPRRLGTPARGADAAGDNSIGGMTATATATADATSGRPGPCPLSPEG